MEITQCFVVFVHQPTVILIHVDKYFLIVLDRVDHALNQFCSRLYTSAFIAQGVPVFDIAEKYGPTDMLVGDHDKGRELARVLEVRAVHDEHVVEPVVYRTGLSQLLRLPLDLGAAVHTRRLVLRDAALAATHAYVDSRLTDLSAWEATLTDELRKPFGKPTLATSGEQ